MVKKTQKETKCNIPHFFFVVDFVFSFFLHHEYVHEQLPELSESDETIEEIHFVIPKTEQAEKWT